MTITINATWLSFCRDFSHLVGRPVSPAWLAAAPGLADLQPGQSATAVFACNAERTIRRDDRGRVHLDPAESKHAED
jgi:hypothetical protein